MNWTLFGLVVIILVLFNIAAALKRLNSTMISWYSDWMTHNPDPDLPDFEQISSQFLKDLCTQMENPFKRFGGRRETSPQKGEQMVRRAMEKELKALGANYLGIHKAYAAAKTLNAEKKLGLTRNHLLNELRKEAYAAADPLTENPIYEAGGMDVDQLIDQEIENIRKEEQDEPQ